ncbi:MAG: metallophosphoesterase, partial [Lachnospiraceae bacterium]|nr:metallophosphoesterase [Lachnospiraceae bacterium]
PEWKVMSFMIFFAALLIIAACLIIFHDIHYFHIVRYQLTHPKLKKALRLVVLADLHDARFGKHNERLAAKVRELSPDLILIAGDMVTSGKHSDYTGAEDLLCGLAGMFSIYYGMGNHESRIVSDPVYYGMGNHESRIVNDPEENGERFEEYKRKLSRAGVVFLQNETVVLDEYNIALHGLELEKEYYRKWGRSSLPSYYMKEKFGKASPEAFHLLIAHNPEFFPQYADWRADLVVSGHVHGGIVRLPVLGGVVSTSFRLFPKYDGGLFMEKNSAMVISRGLGWHSIPVRMFNPGECVVIDLKPGEKADGHICKAGEI